MALHRVTDLGNLPGSAFTKSFAEEDFEEEVVVPAAAASLHGDALLAGVLLEQ